MNNIIGVINFNTLCKKNSSSFMSSKYLSWEEHKSKILCPENINFRLNILTKYSIPNLCDNIPKNINFKIIILYSTLLSSNIISILKQYASKYDSIVLHSRTEEDYLGIDISIKKTLQNINSNSDDYLFCSFRLDDDDILSSQYLYNLNKYIKIENLNKFISFSNGLEILWHNNQIKKTCNYKKDFIAIGLAHIGLYSRKLDKFLTNPKTVYAGINHFEIPKRFESIIDESPHSFIYSRHDHQDTNLKYKFNNNNNINIEELDILFPSLKNSYFGV